jgi:hypothetical protein
VHQGVVSQSLLDAEAATFAADTRHFELSAVRGADGFDDGEPQPGATLLAGTGAVDAEESLEHVRERLQRDADSVVRDLQNGLFVLTGDLE